MNFQDLIYIKFLQCMSDVCCMSRFFTKTTNLYISAKNKDNDTKPSGNDPWGFPRSSMVSSKCPVRNL